MGTKGTIYFDMDGTIADFYNVPNWLDSVVMEDVAPYQNAEPMWNMTKLNAVLSQLIEQGWEISVISWAAKDASPEYREAIRKAKLEWLAHYNFPYKQAHIIEYGVPKASLVNRKPAILIDDNQEVRDGWNVGKTINPNDGDLIEQLEALLEPKEQQSLTLYCISPSNCTYDQYDDTVVLAKNMDEALKLCEHLYYKEQWPLTTKPIDMVTPGVVSSEFNAG